MKKKEFIVLLSIILFDLVTKLTANFYLPFQEDVYVFGDSVSFYLTYNQGSTGGQANFIMEGENNKNLTIILSCISGLILLTYFLYIRKREIGAIYKVLIAIGLFIVLSFLMETFRLYFSNATISSWTTSVIGKLTGLILYGTLFFLSKGRWIRFFSSMILACGVGNLLSHFYMPYRVIDFISIEGSYELLRIGVFNFADLAFDIGAIGLIISILILLLKKIRMNKTKPTPVK